MGDGGLVNTAPEDSAPVDWAHHATQSDGIASDQVIACDD
jgi:hypothetical protein